MPRFASKTLLWIMLGVCLTPFVMDMLLLRYYHMHFMQGCEITGERFTDGTYTLQHRILKPDDPIESRYTARLSVSELEKIGDEDLCLLVSRMNGQGARIYLNDVLIGSMGDPDGGRANIWNAAFVFPIDAQLLQPQNTLSFEIHHEYEAGIGGSVIITDAQSARRMLDGLTFVTGTLSGISIGMALCGCAIVFSIALLNQRRHSPYVFLAISLAALSVYAAGYLPIAHLPVSYLVFQKIAICALFLSAAGVSITVSKVIYRKLPMIVGLACLGIVLIGIVVTRDALAFKHWYQVCMALIPVSITVWLCAAVPCCRIKEESRIFLPGLVLFLLMSVYTVFMLYLAPGYLPGSVFPYVAVYLTMLIRLNTLDIRRKNEAIEQESSRRFHFYRKAVTDGLTGLFNRDYMIAHLEKEDPPFAAAMLDIDDFKHINDQYGHQVGDGMIQFASKMLTRSLRETDKIGRYGGDEFIVILSNCEPNAYSIMERFRSEIAKSSQTIGDKQLTITFSIGICYITDREPADQILRKADKALYLAKQNGKNMVCMYE